VVIASTVRELALGWVLLALLLFVAFEAGALVERRRAARAAEREREGARS
jgi:hypothetical protein